MISLLYLGKERYIYLLQMLEYYILVYVSRTIVTNIMILLLLDNRYLLVPILFCLAVYATEGDKEVNMLKYFHMRKT